MSLRDRLEKASARALEDFRDAHAPQSPPALPDPDDPSFLSFTELQPELTSLMFARDREAKRSEGWHVMEIVEDLELAWLDAREKAMRMGADPNAFTEEDLDQFAMVGFLWEWGIGAWLNDAAFQNQILKLCGEEEVKLIHPGELELDGIFGTPDDLDVRGRALEEWKATWISARHDIRVKKRRWIIQAMAYCWMLGVNKAVLRVFFLNGRYEKYQMGAPIVRFYRFRWTDQELEENWQMIVGHRDEMAKGRIA